MPGHVLDTCVVEDLRTAGLLAVSCASLDRAVVGGFTASLDNELAQRMAELQRYRVAVRHLSAAEVAEQLSIVTQHHQLSAADAEALVIAQADHAVLLTSDGSLRRVAMAEGVTVRGVIGELRRLVTRVLIDPPTALAGLESILDSGSRLPAGEVDRVRREWRRRVLRSEKRSRPGQDEL